MDRIEGLLGDYLRTHLDLGSSDRTKDCPDGQVLLGYLYGTLSEITRRGAEHHIAGCGFCLGQLSIAAQGQEMDSQGTFGPVPQKLTEKTKTLLGTGADKGRLKLVKKRAIKKHLFLVAAVIFFVLSFLIPKYFMQFLVATLILGIRWCFESESGRTLVMVLDSWRRHSRDKDKDDEISRHLNNRL